LVAVGLSLQIRQSTMIPAVAARELEVGTDGLPKSSDEGGDRDLERRLVADSDGALTEQQYRELASYLQKLSKSKDTARLVKQMREGSGKKAFENFAANDGTKGRHEKAKQLVLSMHASLKVIKVVDEIFSVRPEEALGDLIKEGLVDAEMLKKYEDDPENLEPDIKRAVQFKFVAVSAAGGYL